MYEKAPCCLEIEYLEDRGQVAGQTKIDEGKCLSRTPVKSWGPIIFKKMKEETTS